VRIVAVRGKLAVAHLSTSQSGGDVEVGRIELDLRGISALLPTPQHAESSIG
jgi:hypothetical protein